MLSFSPFSSTPYSALGETLVEIDANLENFSLIDSSSLISIFSESLFGNEVLISSLASNRIYSSYDFLGKATLDLSSRISSYNLSTLEANFESLQSGIIKASQLLELNAISNISASSRVKINELAGLVLNSEIEAGTKIKIISDSNLFAEFLLIADQIGGNTLFSESELNSFSELLNLSKVKLYSSQEFNSVANVSYNPKIKFYNLSDINNFVILNALEKLNVTGLTDLEAKSEFFSQYLNKSHGGIDLNSETYFLIDSYLKNYNLSTLNAVVNFQPFAKLSFSGSSSNFEILTGAVSDSKIKIFDSIDLNTEATFLSNYLSRTIGDIVLNNQANVLFYPNYKTYGNWITESNIQFSPSSQIKFYDNLSDMRVIGIVTTNLSQRNRDIVYYILAINKEEPFELKILRSK